jgi:hypothetical protein
VSTRRVIFPPPETWTRKASHHPSRRETNMTTNENSDKASDYRRAALFTKYHRQGNKAGQVAIVEEVNETGRVPQLLFALLVLHKTFITRFRTPDGIDLLADFIHSIATLVTAGMPTPDVVRAAQILDHHGHNDHDAIAKVMSDATAEGRATETFLALLDHYEVSLPELSGRAGIAFIEANALAMLEVEYRPDGE